jgi:hypothetical protein
MARDRNILSFTIYFARTSYFNQDYIYVAISRNREDVRISSIEPKKILIL